MLSSVFSHEHYQFVLGEFNKIHSNGSPCVCILMMTLSVKTNMFHCKIENNTVATNDYTEQTMKCRDRNVHLCNKRALFYAISFCKSSNSRIKRKVYAIANEWIQSNCVQIELNQLQSKFMRKIPLFVVSFTFSLGNKEVSEST